MCTLKLALCLVTLGYVTASHAPKIEKCHRSDLRCVSNLVNQISNGFPEYGIASMDTVVIPEMKIEGCGLTLRNIHVSGLTNQNIDELKVHPDQRTLKLGFSAQVQIRADAILESRFPVHNPWYPIVKKIYHGQYQATANTWGYSLYPIDIKNTNGEDFYEIGSEVTVSEVKGKPEATLRFDGELQLDPHTLDESVLRAHGEQLHNLIISKVVSKAYSSLFTNARSIAGMLNRGTFFYDL